MARRLDAIFEVRAVLTAEVALHVGNRDDQLGQDAPVALDGRGKPYLPGTSLAGPMRAWWREAFGENPDVIETLWGRIEETEKEHKKRDPKGKTEKRGGFASLLSVEDAAVFPGGGPPELRDGVGIDPVTGGASENIKFDRQVLPAGTTFGLRLRFEVPADDTATELGTKGLTREKVEERLATLLVALEAGDILFGGGKTRGLGRLTAKGFKIVRHDVNTKDGVLDRLRWLKPRADENEGKAQRNEARPATKSSLPWDAFKTQAAKVQDSRVVLELHWQAATPVLNKAGIEGLTIDALPLVTGVAGGRVSPVLTGSSIKGVLRAHAARICRTMAKAYEAPGKNGERDAIADRLIETLFGAPGRANPKDEGAKNGGRTDPDIPSKLGLGALAIDDCSIGPDLSAADWRSIIDATGDKEEAVTKAQSVVAGKKGWQHARLSQHVAIDRWTGGAAENLLFNRLEPPVPGECTFRLTLDTRRLVTDVKDVNGVKDEAAKHVRDAAIILLLFVLRDMARGRIPVGFGGNRGLGAITLTRVAIVRAGNGAAARGFAAGGEITGAQLVTGAREALGSFEAANKAWKDYWSDDKKTDPKSGGAP